MKQPKHSIELEFKLLAPNPQAMEALPQALKEVLGEARDQGETVFHDRDLDRGDWRLWRAGLGLRSSDKDKYARALEPAGTEPPPRPFGKQAEKKD